MKKFCIYLTVISFLLSAQICISAPENGLGVQQSENALIKQEIIILYNTNKIKEAYRLISTIPESQRDSELWLLAANITEDYGRDLDAETLLEKAISVDCNNYKAYYNLGNIQFKGNKYYSAINSYKKCLKIKKDFSFAWYNLGNVYLAINDYTRAKSAFMRAISFDTVNPDFYYNLAYTYKKLNKTKQAEKMLNIYNTLIEEK